MSNAKNKHRNIRKGGHVKTVRYHDLLRAKRTQNPLSGLNPAKVRRLYELYREGKYADVQLAWDALEEYDDMLGTVLNRRQSALGEMEWDVLIDARAVGASSLTDGSLSTPTQGVKSDLQALAEAQQDFITRRLREVENLSDAIKWLGLADFRRYSALEVLPAGSGERWLPIHHWLLCRPALEGAWCYNENAETSCTRVEPIDMSAVLLREVARPIDLVAMFLISAKEAAIDGWDSFLEVFGNPALFFKMPPGTSDAQRDEFAAIIKEISSDGSGVYPDGGEIHTVETSAANADAFSSRAEWCDKALVRRATGGLLTVLAESGSGTLAGSAHMEAFRQIAANDAISIAECINRQYVRRRIAAEFPGEPVLVYFTLTPPVINDRAATVNMLCQLAGQRWRATDEAVSEEVGVEVHTEEAAPQPPMMNTTPHTPGIPPAEPVLNACNQFAHDPDCPDAKPDKMPDDADDELREAFADADSMAHSGYTREQIWDATGIDYGPTPNGDSPTAADTIRRARAHERTQLNPRSATARFAHRRAAAHKQALQDAEITNSAITLEQPEQEPPLTEDELAAFRGLSEPNRERMEQHRAEVEQALRAAADLDAPADDEEEPSAPQSGYAEPGEVVANGCTKPGCPKHPRKGESTGAMMHQKKGSRGSKGNPSATKNKTSIPSELPTNATDGELSRQLKKGLDDTDAHKGNRKISRGDEVYELTQERSDHRRKHQKQKTTNENIARTMTQGDFEKDGKGAVAYRKDTKVVKSTNKDTGTQDVTTAYVEHEYRLKSQKGKPQS